MLQREKKVGNEYKKLEIFGQLNLRRKFLSNYREYSLEKHQSKIKM